MHLPPSSSEEKGAIRVVQVEVSVKFKGIPRVGMVLMHPHLSLVKSGSFYILSDECKGRQKHTIQQCLELAKSAHSEGVCFTDFIVLPEYSVPSDMIDEIQVYLEDSGWPNNSILICGVEPMPLAQFAVLIKKTDNPLQTTKLKELQGEYVNFCLIFIKDGNGKLHKFVQPKLRPSAPEQATQAMYEGDFVLLFQTDALSFTCLICFDAVAEEAYVPIAETLLEGISKLAARGQSMNLDLVVIPQHNPFAEHPEFLKFAQTILTKGGGSVRPEKGAVIYVNSAACDVGRSQSKYGRSAIYYGQSVWQAVPEDGPINDIPATYALEGFKGSDKWIVRARFREDGPCAHYFEYFIPSLCGGAVGSS